MSLILNIETSTATASLCLTDSKGLEDLQTNSDQKDHAGWLHTAIDKLLQKNNYTVADLNAVAVSIGPGSYTGLRVGLASAKGFCYALNIPLIAISTLKMMAFAVKDEAPEEGLICPMIDARRMEVFTAVYSKSLIEKIAPQSIIVDGAFERFLDSDKKIIFCGNGSKKLQPYYTAPNIIYADTEANALHLGRLAAISFEINDFADLAYTEPVYIKEFYNPTTR